MARVCSLLNCAAKRRLSFEQIGWEEARVLLLRSSERSPGLRACRLSPQLDTASVSSPSLVFLLVFASILFSYFEGFVCVLGLATFQKFCLSGTGP